MKLTMFTTLTVLTTAVFAAPQHEISQTKSRDLQARLDTTTYTGITPTTKTTLIAGVGITEPLDPATDSYAHVTAHFVVPTIQDKNPGVVSALIALDGTSTGRRILTGINIHVTGDGDTIYIQIQEWEPSPSFSFTANDSQAFPIHPGDDLTFALSIAPRKDSVTAIMTSANTGLTITAKTNAPTADTNGIGASAMFMMLRSPNSPLLNFGTANFTKCVAITSGGSSVDFAGGPPGSKMPPEFLGWGYR